MAGLDSHCERGWARVIGRLCEEGDCYAVCGRKVERNGSRGALIVDRVENARLCRCGVVV